MSELFLGYLLIMREEINKGDYMSILLAFLLGLSTLPAFALNTGFMFHQESINGSKNSHQTISYFPQKLDHNNPESEIFNQRYFIDSRNAKGPDSPVFYIICGEWNCAGTGSYRFVENLAKKESAHLIALEHRYYGESLPTKVLTPEALKFLNLESAIADLASFQRFMMEEKGFKGRWISFGGSYAGTLSAFYRQRHPELVSGALASSAPVFMKNAFFEYDAHIAKVINKSQCGDSVRKAISLIEERMSTEEGTLKVKALFKAQDVKNDGDFLYVVADMLAAAVQYGHDDVFCEALLKNSDPVEGYAKGGLEVLDSMLSTPSEISLSVAEKEEVTPNDNLRQWMWQSCTQFGWFQVANGNGQNSARSERVDLPYHNEVCQRLYKIPISVDGALNEQWYFPLSNPETTKIIFSNGSNDPWQTLSVTNEASLFDIFIMEGAAHCNDLKLFSEYPSVVVAQSQMETIVHGWLKDKAR
jgi:pimeloyl-ACP methyl ester carboxylesterase